MKDPAKMKVKEPAKMKGRKSEKKEQLLKIYRFLRAMMTSDDVKLLRKEYPKFFEHDETNTDFEISVATEVLIEIMSKVSPPDWDNREKI